MLAHNLQLLGKADRVAMVRRVAVLFSIAVMVLLFAVLMILDV